MEKKTVKGTQGALDITDIFDKNAELQTLHLVLQDTDGGFIATSPLYIVQTIIDKIDWDLPPLFPCPAPTWPEDPIDDIDKFFKEYKGPSPLELAVAAAFTILMIFFGMTGAFS